MWTHHSMCCCAAAIDSSSIGRGPYSRGNGSVEGEGSRGRGSPMAHPCQEGVLQQPCCIRPFLWHPALHSNGKAGSADVIMCSTKSCCCS